MSDETLTLILDGEIPLDLFARAMTQFNGLVAALSDEVADDEPVQWHVERLHAGSAVIDVRPYSNDLEAVERIVRAYDEIGEALSRREPVPFSPTVSSFAYGLTGLLNGKISALSLRTRFNLFTVHEPAPVGETQTPGARHLVSWGQVRGDIGAIIRRPRLQMTLYDELFDRGVPCYLDTTWQRRVYELWDKRIAVTGLVYRDEITDRPLKIREVVSIDVLSPPTGDYRRARGVIPWQPGQEPAEVTIRRLRDEPET